MDEVIKWKDLELVVKNPDISTPNDGRLSKQWVEDINTGKIYLIKGSGYMGYEPFSEKMAFIIGRALGIDVLEYDIIPAKLFKNVIKLNPFCKYVSICEKLDKHGYNITSIRDIKRARNVNLTKEHPNPYTNREVMYEILPKENIDQMLFFDAIIGNTDRHYGNVHLLTDFDGNFICAPLLDNGASLLATHIMPELLIFGYNAGKVWDFSYTLEKTHTKQIKYISTINTKNINITSKILEVLNGIEPVLELLPKKRAEYIKKYIVYRMHTYIGAFK